MNILTQSKQYLDHLTNRKRNPARPATLSAYKTYINRWIIPNIGLIELDKFENGAMKDFVQVLVDAGLSASTINSVENCVKGIFKSALDENGNCLYPRVWNADYIDAPIINPKEQKAPTISRQALQEAITRMKAYRLPVVALLAGSGLRMAEVRALRRGPDDGKQSFWIPEDSLLIIRGQLRGRNFYPPKTAAGIREVDIHPELNDLLKQLDRPEGELLFTNRNGRAFRPMTVYKDLKKEGIPPFHSLRRFRTTHLRGQQVPEELIKFWVGHGGGSITDRYSKLAQDKQFRKDWTIKAGLGFSLEGKWIGFGIKNENQSRGKFG